MIKTLAALPLLAGTWLVGAWLFMVTVGVAHDHWIPALPTIGFTASVAINGVLLASLLARVFLLTLLKEAIK